MKKVILSVLTLALMAPMFGCAMAAAPVNGFLFSDVYGPVDAEGGVGGKRGEACATSYLGWIGTGDASVATAAANGGIKNVTNVDHHSTNLLGLVAKFCTIAYGS